jgi:DprA winged helix domain
MRCRAPGANALTSAADVLESFGIAPEQPRRVELSPAAPDELTRELAVPAAEVATALAELELASLVDEQAGVKSGYLSDIGCSAMSVPPQGERDPRAQGARGRALRPARLL